MNEELARGRLGERDQDGRFSDKRFVCNTIDYRRDAIIEASAGTGKTYTLQSIVLKLLLEGAVDSVKNLLLVTYTEKAAGELKDRIRKVLDEAGCLPPDFDEASICTIHSFCRSLLTEYAFENRVPMQMTICGPDKEMVHEAVLQALHSVEYRRLQGGEFVELMTDAGIAAKDLVAEVEDNFKSTEPLIEYVEKGRAGKKTLHRQSKAVLVNGLRPIAQRIYRELKEATSTMTFDDLVERAASVVAGEAAVEAVGGRSALMESIRRKYRIALVDEFQDTDGRQWEIFKSIFSHKANTIGDGPEPNRGALFVVGDPKQAIYSFRGADIGVYLAARAEILSSSGPGALHTLKTTYRSTPGLVDAFNRIFGAKDGDGLSWFGDMKEGDGRIDYEEVAPPPPGAGKFDNLVCHPEFGDSVELLESLPRGRLPKTPASANSGYGNKTCCLPEFLRNAADEIKRLVSLGPAAYTTVDEATGKPADHTFSYRDMCILVRGHAEADKAREILSAAKIPFTIYKEQGVYSSAEAEALLALFDFLAAPSGRGRLEALLLTPLMGCGPDRLEARRRHEDRALQRRLAVWQELAAKREWSRLFESVMNDTLLACPAKDDPDFDRRRAATRQILDKLLENGGRKAQTIDEFAATLRAWRKNDKRAGENGALRRKESEADRVQIMTMHVSKGLEFPVVFVAWGFGRLGGRAKDSAAKAAAIREEKRLLYVALTRAVMKLYLPWSQWAQHRRISKGAETDETGIGSTGSALLIQPGKADAGFLARGIRALFAGGDGGGAQKSDEAAKEAVARVSARAKAAKARAVPAPTIDGDMPAGDTAPAVKVYKLDAVALSRRIATNDSYSSIHRKADRIAVPAEGAFRVDENHEAAEPQKQKERTLLARNNISGDVFHEIMETLCNNDDSDGEALGFCTAGRAGFADLAKDGRFIGLVKRTMRRHQVSSEKDESDDTTEMVLARMAWRALNVPISAGGRTFRLRDVKAADRRAETEFVVNRAKAMGEERASGADAPGDASGDSAFNGKIDLLVRPAGPGGPVYIIDWKTNTLPDYGPAALARAMAASGYHLQYRFYAQAVRYWLGGAVLGGVAYLFVRAGEKSESTAGDTGVFAAEPAAIDEAACRAAINEALRREEN